MGVVYAVLAYGSWGILPIYWKALAGVPADQIIAWRILGTVAFSALLLAGLRRFGELRAIVHDRREAGLLLMAGLLVSTNWLIFVWAVQNDQLLEASFGYYLNPLLSVFLGRLFLGERLSRAQSAAIVIAGIGVSVFGLEFGGLPRVSLALATTFGLYGLIHKLCEARPIPALGFETAGLLPLASIYLWVFVEPAGGVAPALDATSSWLLGLAGPATALPLLWFASAARRLPLSQLGLFQYLAPSLSFLLALFVYHEPWSQTHALAFGFIWSALALFTLDTLKRNQGEAPERNTTPTD